VLDAFVVSMCELRKRVSRENKHAFCRSIIAEVVTETRERLGASEESSDVSGEFGVCSAESSTESVGLREAADKARGAGGSCASVWNCFGSFGCVSGECAHLGTVGASAQCISWSERKVKGVSRSFRWCASVSGGVLGSVRSRISRFKCAYWWTVGASV
jgi:hypothetical protein